MLLRLPQIPFSPQNPAQRPSPCTMQVIIFENGKQAPLNTEGFIWEWATPEAQAAAQGLDLDVLWNVHGPISIRILRDGYAGFEVGSVQDVIGIVGRRRSRCIVLRPKKMLRTEEEELAWEWVTKPEVWLENKVVQQRRLPGYRRRPRYWMTWKEYPGGVDAEVA